MKVLTEKEFLELNTNELEELKTKLKTEIYCEIDNVKVSVERKETSSPEIFEKEMKAAKILANLGYEVYLLPENFAMKNNQNRSFADSLTNNRFLDFKQVEGFNPGRDYKKSMSQGDDVFLYIVQDLSKAEIIKNIKENQKYVSSRRKSLKSNVFVHFSTTNETTLLKINKKGDITEVCPHYDTNVDRTSLTSANQKESL